MFENPDRLSGFSKVGGDLNANTLRFDHRVALFRRMNTSYIVQACNAQGCTDSEEVTVPDSLAQAVGYFKANDADRNDSFGSQVAMSTDGNTMAVTASKGAGTSNLGSRVYVFGRVDGVWQQQAMLDNAYATSLRAAFLKIPVVEPDDVDAIHNMTGMQNVDGTVWYWVDQSASQQAFDSAFESTLEKKSYRLPTLVKPSCHFIFHKQNGF